LNLYINKTPRIWGFQNKYILKINSSFLQHLSVFGGIWRIAVVLSPADVFHDGGRFPAN
jgi:hypothetical protein